MLRKLILVVLIVAGSITARAADYLVRMETTGRDGASLRSIEVICPLGQYAHAQTTLGKETIQFDVRLLPGRRDGDFAVKLKHSHSTDTGSSAFENGKKVPVMRTNIAETSALVRLNTPMEFGGLTTNGLEEKLVLIVKSYTPTAAKTEIDALPPKQTQ